MTVYAPEAIIRAPERLQALRESGLLDSEAERSFDRLTRLASRALDVPVALVSLVDADRQFFKSACGLPSPWAEQRQTPLSHSFCQHVVAAGEPFLVEDARSHPLVSANGAVADLNVIAYAGVPLRGPDGLILGSMCAIDSEPRIWTTEDVDLLTDLADAATAELTLRVEHARALRTEDQLRQAEERLEGAFAAATIGMGLADLDGNWLRVNPALCSMSGYTVDELLAMTTVDMSHPDDVEEGWDQIRPLLAGEVESVHWEKRYLHKDGHAFWADVGLSLVHDAAGAPLHYMVVTEDITERRNARELLQHLATHDPLTDLANRRAFTERLEEHLDHGFGGAVLMLDLDGFKAVNDTFGHHVGDQVIELTAQVLVETLGSDDLAARMGGDEFAVLLPGVDEDAALAMSERVAEQLRVRLAAPGRRISASVGAAMIPARGGSVDALLHQADLAMYRAKRQAVDRWSADGSFPR